MAPNSPSWTCLLPAPISVNALFVNRRGKGMKGRMISPAYLNWRREAEYSLLLSRPLPTFKGRIGVCMAFSEPSRPNDLDNKAKGILDLLVKHKIIQDDSNKFLRMLLMTWDANVKGAKVTISEMA